MLEVAAESKAASVVAAPQESRVARILRDEHAAVSANVGQAMDGVVHVPRENDWFVEKTIEDDRRPNRARDLDLFVIADEVPCRSKDLLLRLLKDRWVGIEPGWDRVGGLDACVDHV